jgi:uncharacterized coiled-coil protein SlyX
VELVIIFIVAICLLWYLSSRDQATQSRIEDLNLQLGDAKREIEDLKDKVEDLKDEFKETSLTDEEKEARFFRSLPDLNASFFKSLQNGQVLDLISGSYYYPHDEIFIRRFQYKHDHIADSTYLLSSKATYEVHGFERLSSDDEWSACMILANEDECTTSSCSGRVKKIRG